MKDILHPLRVLYRRLRKWRNNVLPLYLERLRHPRAVYLVLTPEHGNLGDHAIAQSETEWLTSMSIPFIEVTGKKLKNWKRYGCLSIMNGRSILVHGGGFLGTIWFHNELLLREIVQANPKSSILFLPNTVYYENDANGKEEISISERVYNSHHHLKMYAREKTSFSFMKEHYSNVSIAPDMVLRMNKCIKGVSRNGCILCLRDDREKTRSEENEIIIRTQTTDLFGNQIYEADMVLSYQIPIEKRDAELQKQFDAFRHAELVITDRLHGMIFCAITGTPCIVIDSKSPKVRGCYEWIKDLPYIRFCDDVRKISEIYQEIPKKNWKYDNSKLLPLYESLERDIRKAVKGSKLCH